MTTAKQGSTWSQLARGARRPTVWLTAAVVGSVITLLVQSYGLSVLNDIGGGSSARLGAQLDAIAHSAATHGYVITWHEYASGLHGAGKSLLMKLSDVRDAFSEDVGTPQPEEFRIYDLRDFPTGEPQLIERFRFRPAATKELGELTQWRFNVQQVADITRTGKTLIVGDFSENRADYSTHRPVLIYWNDESENYTIRPLIPFRPRLVAIPEAGVRTDGYLNEYAETERLVDRENGVSVTPYAATAYAVCGSHIGIDTIGAYWVSEGGPPPTPTILQLLGSSISILAAQQSEATRKLLEPRGPILWERTEFSRFPSQYMLIQKARSSGLGCYRE